jgi:hypothetical protein
MINFNIQFLKTMIKSLIILSAFASTTFAQTGFDQNVYCNFPQQLQSDEQTPSNDPVGPDEVQPEFPNRPTPGVGIDGAGSEFQRRDNGSGWDGGCDIGSSWNGI